MPLTGDRRTQVSAAIDDLKRLRGSLSRAKQRQIRTGEEKAYLKAIALAWFQSYRPDIGKQVSHTDLVEIDSGYQAILSASERSPSSAKVAGIAKKLIGDLVALQALLVSNYAPARHASDSPPAFPSIPDQVMRRILIRRWQECVNCLSADAPLAATVMMGGLLEGLFLARVNRDPNKSAIFTARTAPRDSKTRQTLPLKEWTLKDFIAVAQELGWISQSVRDVSQILRDYRNYIHPQTELTNQLSLQIQDAEVFWVVCKAIAMQLS
jgi:hypothetical protein